MIDKAVILAAGLGNRISKVAGHIPKPLLPLDGKAGSPTFLDWHLWSLARIGVKEIYLVGSQRTYGTELLAMKSVPATWIRNPTEDMSTSGSGHSAQFAWKSEFGILDGKSRVVLMDADILYDPALFTLLGEARGKASKTLVCADYRNTQEEVMVFAPKAAPDAPSLHGKGLLDTPLTIDAVCLGEATGILLFEPEEHAALTQVTDWVIRYSTAKTRSEHEDITQRMMGMGRMMPVGFGRDRAFMECDTPEEYEVVKHEMFPRLRGLLGC
jgi:choline kinase